MSLIGVDPCNSSLHMWLWYEHKLNFLLQFDIEVANCYFVNTNMRGLLFLQNNIISCAFVFSQGFHHLSARNSSAVKCSERQYACWFKLIFIQLKYDRPMPIMKQWSLMLPYIVIQNHQSTTAIHSHSTEYLVERYCLLSIASFARDHLSFSLFHIPSATLLMYNLYSYQSFHE